MQYHGCSNDDQHDSPTYGEAKAGNRHQHIIDIRRHIVWQCMHILSLERFRRQAHRRSRR